ncbi:MAG TPA: ROK family transcriptional regulator [Mycobacteriales bacterium]|nr:ROK family transcriptional regulator [Mycobacteriales bacterium]
MATALSLAVEAAGTRGAEPLRAVLDVLRGRGPLTRSELAETTGLSRSTISGLVSDLRRRGLVDDRPEPGSRTGGRPATLVTLLPPAGVAVGVDIGRTHVRVVIADLGHAVLAEESVRYDVDGHPDETLATAGQLVNSLLVAISRDSCEVIGVGLGIPAPLDGAGSIGASNILPGWVGLRPADLLAERLGLPVQAENDANLGALAEARWGAGRDARLVVYIKAATGIGAGIVDDGRLFRGASGTAGELGHMTVGDGGAVCRCGNRGCLELRAGGPALLAQVRSAGHELATLTELVARARAGDPGCRRVLADAGDSLGLAVANLVNLINPDRIVFGGELGLAGEMVLATLRDRVSRSAVAPAAAAVTICPAELGDRAEALGAALLVLRDVQNFDDRLLRGLAASR